MSAGCFHGLDLHALTSKFVDHGQSARPRDIGLPPEQLQLRVVFRNLRGLRLDREMPELAGARA
jgi:hypothetical protein